MYDSARMFNSSELRKRKGSRTIYRFRASDNYEEGTGTPPKSKDLWQGFKDFTTAHGVPHIDRAKGPIKRMFWTICLLGCLTGFFYNFISISILYSRFLVSVRVQLLHNREMPFPAVTICNSNPVKSSAVFNSPRLVALLQSWGVPLKNGTASSRKKRNINPNEIIFPQPPNAYIKETDKNALDNNINTRQKSLNLETITNDDISNMDNGDVKQKSLDNDVIKMQHRKSVHNHQRGNNGYNTNPDVAGDYLPEGDKYSDNMKIMDNSNQDNNDVDQEKEISKHRSRRAALVSDSSCSDLNYILKEHWAISGHNDVQQNNVATAAACKAFCDGDSSCKSVDYEAHIVASLKCMVSYSDQHTASGSFGINGNFDYYEKCSGCNSGHPTPADATRVCQDSFPNWSATYTCTGDLWWSSDGTKSKTITCSCQTETWGTLTDTCVTKADCAASPDMTIFNMGKVNIPGIKHGAIQDYSCLNSYTFYVAGLADQQICQAGIWVSYPTSISMGFCDLPTKTTFHLYTSSKSYDNASQSCIEKGGHIAMITSEQKMKKIRELLRCRSLIRYKRSHRMAWIGLMFNKQSSNWQWINGEIASYTNWLPGQPQRKECVRIVNSRGQWATRKCLRKYAYICEGDIKNPCFPNPCLHGGTCCSVNDAPQCNCPSPYRGGLCEIEPYVSTTTALEPSTLERTTNKATISTLVVVTTVAPSTAATTAAVITTVTPSTAATTAAVTTTVTPSTAATTVAAVVTTTAPTTTTAAAVTTKPTVAATTAAAAAATADATNTAATSATTKATTPSPSPSTTTPESVTSQFSERNENPLREDFKKEEDLLKVFADLDEQTKKDLGYTYNDMIIDCQYEGRDCSEQDFDYFFDAVHGNCYVFNAGWDWPANKTYYYSHRAGRRYGLKVVLNIGQYEYLQGVGEAAGAVVVVHSANRMPFPEDEGVLAVPGSATSVGVKMIEVTRLPDPYGDCVDNSVPNVTKNVFEELFPIKYSSNACFKTCYQRYVIDECHCADPQYPMYGTAFGNKLIKACDIRNITEDDCKYSMTQKYIRNELDCSCPNPCQDTSFVYSVSSMMWPADKQEKSTIDAFGSSLSVLKSMNDSSAYRRNLLKLDIYFEEFNYEQVQEFPSYPIAKLFSDVGGIIGLWIGCSVLSVAEFLELFFDLIILGCYKITKKPYWGQPKKRSQSINDSSSNISSNISEETDLSQGQTNLLPPSSNRRDRTSFISRRNSLIKRPNYNNKSHYASSISSGVSLPGIILEDSTGLESSLTQSGGGKPIESVTTKSNNKSFIQQAGSLVSDSLSIFRPKRKSNRSPPPVEHVPMGNNLPTVEGGLRINRNAILGNEGLNDETVRRRGQFSEDNPAFKFI